MSHIGNDDVVVVIIIIVDATIHLTLEILEGVPIVQHSRNEISFQMLCCCFYSIRLFCFFHQHHLLDHAQAIVLIANFLITFYTILSLYVFFCFSFSQIENVQWKFFFAVLMCDSWWYAYYLLVDALANIFVVVFFWFIFFCSEKRSANLRQFTILQIFAQNRCIRKNSM